MDSKFNTAVARAAKQVFNSLFGDGGSKDVGMDSIKGGSDLGAVISFTGEPTGEISLFCSHSAANHVASCILGTDADGNKEEISDAVGELLNMIIGVAKGHYATNSDPIQISLPTIIPDYRALSTPDPKPGEAADDLLLRLNGFSEYITLRVLLKS